MVYLTADETILLKELGLFVEPVEISDESGNLLGLFVPANLERGKRLYAELASRADHEELDRRAAERGKGRTTREVFEPLHSLTDDPTLQAYLQQKINRLQSR